MIRIIGQSGRRRRLALLGTIFTTITLLAVIVVPSAQAVLPGSPSNFESGNDPTLGLGNMMVDNSPVPPPTPHTDWVSVANAGAPYVHLTDAAASTSDDSFEPGSKQDTACPVIEGHKNPPKDDFTDIASYIEVNTDPTSANFGDTYLYGATIRYAANGNASENIELNQGTGDLCPGSTLESRVAGDKLIAIDYLGGGKAVEFHVLTWVISGACFVGSHTAPCWGADVLTLDPNEAEGGVNDVAITAANNPISGVALKAGQFAEFGINLAAAGIVDPDSCVGFTQIVWESRSAGSSFVSSTKDIKIQPVNINVCASVSVRKVGSDGGSQEGVIFTLYSGPLVDATKIVGTCTVNAAGDCVDPVTGLNPFVGLNPGEYTIDETNTPSGYTKDADLPDTFTLADGESLALEYTNVAQRGAIQVTKTRKYASAAEGDPFNQPHAGVVFTITGGAIPAGTTETTNENGVACFDDLPLNVEYTVTETVPDGYASEDSEQTATPTDEATCADATFVGELLNFVNDPLTDLDVTVTAQDPGATLSTVSCVDVNGDPVGTPITTPVDPAAFSVDGLEIGTYTCTIVIDP